MKIFYSVIIFFSVIICSKASIHQISVADFSFTPSTVNAVCGDTILWTWSSGTHTTTSKTIPGCATAWNNPVNSTATSYSIVVSCAGNYNYQCTFHASMGMTGTIAVTCVGGISSYNANYFSAAYPNPFTTKIIIAETEAKLVSIYNVIGERIKSIPIAQLQTKTEIDLRDLQSGIYFFELLKEGEVIETKKIVKQ